ncbi:MAG: hypothetical protein CVU65_00165 [Deltaproteobacteria bacterium HGW-Deltaproteobacteria-22]|jgi:hypothetical protein|nr:MAG: hypothetical protein CVU65_00165 [Deltaproteobacteria bacterium HGW-Deltaproteobacteria-22]
MRVPISVFTSHEPPRLTKSITLENDQLVILPGGNLWNGEVKRVEADFPHGFIELLIQLLINQACGYGVPNVDEAHVTTRENVGPGDLARIRENFRFLAGLAIMMIDFDIRPGTMPLTREELVGLLVSVCPEIADCALVVTDSASTFIVNEKTGEVLKGEGGKRVYLVAKNGQDIPRAGQLLFDRLVLAGHGYIQVTKAGTMLLRTSIDGSVWQPERLDFAAGAACGKGLVQLRPAPTVKDGSVLDTVTALTALTPEEDERLKEIVAALKADAQDEADAVRAAWIEDRIQKDGQRAGRPQSPEEAQHMRDRLGVAAATHVLPDEFVLHGQAGEVTVGELLGDQEKWNGKTFSDPLEPDYHGGERLAQFIVKPGKPPYIWSFAHGGLTYTFTSIPTTSLPAPMASKASAAPSPTEKELIDQLLAIPTDTPSDQLPKVLQSFAYELVRANPVMIKKVLKAGAKHFKCTLTDLGKLIIETERQQLEKLESEGEPQEDEYVVIARGVARSTGDSLVCIEPPSRPSMTPTFHRVNTEGHLSPVRPEELHDLFNTVAGRPLEPSEFTLVAWYLATAVLEFRGGEVLQKGILCKNGFISFELDRWFTPGRPKQPAVFYVPRTFIEDPTQLPPLESLKTIQAWERWGVNIVALIEMIARLLLTRQTGICIIFWGPGGEGKSTFMKYVAILVGDSNILHAQIADFTGERRLRGISTLRGKLLAVFDDAPHNVFDILGPFIKEATTAETLTGAPVYQDATSFLNTSLIVILSNHPSIGKDRTRGGADRRNVHVWSHRIRYTAENQMDAELAWTQDEAEMDIIFSYGVHFARRYLETGTWQYTQPVEEAVYLAEALTTVEARFLWERFQQSESHYISWDDIDVAYNKWWPDYDHRDTFSHDRFFAAVEVTWGGEVCRRQEDHYRTRGVTGIKLLPKQKPTFTPKPGLADVDLGVGQVVSGQKNPRIEGYPFRGEEKEEEGGEQENIYQETGSGAGTSVGFSGHLDLPEEIVSVTANVDELEHFRLAVTSHSLSEGALHLNRVREMLPEHLRPMAKPMIDDLVAQGVISFDGTFVSMVDPEEVP